jgi:lon-related putative ATP-dependent protease
MEETMTVEGSNADSMLDWGSPIDPLTPNQLYRRADLSVLAFATTADLQPLDGLAGQARASEALKFGTQIRSGGFNLCVIGSEGARMEQSIKAMLAETASHERKPSDWIYVNNFAEPHRPVAIELPPGRAPALRDAMHELIEDLKATLPAAFESSDFQARRAAIDQAAQKRQEEAFAALREKAAGRNVAILRTPGGFVFTPMRDGEIVPPKDFAAWPEVEQKAAQSAMEGIEPELEQTLRSMPRWDKERREEVRKLEQETVQASVAQTIEEAKAGFLDLDRVLKHFETIRSDLIENAGLFVAPLPDEEIESARTRLGGPFDRYEVNILVTQAESSEGAPIIEEAHPTLGNLTGRIEYMSQQGVLVTNFRLIKAGSLHRANGGYLLINLRNLLMEGFSWASLKRALLQRQIVIEDIARLIGLTTTISLEPDPIPLDIKVLLFGDRLLYYLLDAFDPELSRHFKVLVDFDDDFDRSQSAEANYARLIAALIQKHELLPFDRTAVERVIEHAARLAEDAEKLSLVIERIHDILAESSFYAKEEGRAVVARADVERAIDQKVRRASRLQQHSQEMILRNIALIDSDGSHIGQINGLSVISLGGYSFGRATRITCRVRPGAGKIVDIEREVELGGPLHSKGVLILAGFLAGRYALDAPMSLSASLVFEQSYGGVEGDSASSAELYALLSAIGEIPLRQDLAVTGSVNQHGQIQAIGGVNEKIEGFFDVCNARGLTGKQGVIIPKANVKQLMLRQDVVDACATGKFAVYPVETIDQGIALLTMRPSGERDQAGVYPEQSINRLVEDRLQSFAKARRAALAESFEQAREENE